MTAVLLLSSGCAVQIKDYQFCSPIPGNLGAVCDNLLTSNQLILSEADWIALQNTWQTEGFATECTTSQAVGDIKSEFEKICSKTKCTYPTIQAIAGLKRIAAHAQKRVLP